MKILIVTQNEPFFIPKLLRSIIKAYKPYLKAIILLKPDEYKNKIYSIVYYLKFWGVSQSFKFAIQFLKTLFKKKNLNEINIVKNINVNSPDFIRVAKKVDYIISVASNQIFKEELLNSPKEMCLNIHAGLLPKNKGFNPSFWVLFKNEKCSGITLHKMDKFLDNGPIIVQKKFNIKPNETWFTLQNQVIIKSKEILIDILPKLINKSFRLEKQIGKASKFKKPDANYGAEFRKRGKRFI